MQSKYAGLKIQAVAVKSKAPTRKVLCRTNHDGPADRVAVLPLVGPHGVNVPDLRRVGDPRGNEAPEDMSH